ncbi:hypothetical protein AB4250_19170, partial [Vibrio cyclitrophicus]
SSLSSLCDSWLIPPLIQSVVVYQPECINLHLASVMVWGSDGVLKLRTISQNSSTYLLGIS